MTDLELLTLAAKAAGLTVWAGTWPQDDMVFAAPSKPDASGKVTGVEWNPLADDADALRLAVALDLHITHYESKVMSRTSSMEMDIFEQFVGARTDQQMRLAATRRAIVRAAAAIGKGKP